MRMLEHHFAISDELSRYGIKAQVEETSGGHIRFRWTANGRPQTLIASKSPSDHRTDKNAVAHVRRLMRMVGIKPVINGHGPRGLASTPLPARTIDERIVALERDVRMLLDLLTHPALSFSIADKARAEPEPPPRVRQRKRERARAEHWLWKVLSFQEWKSIDEIVGSAQLPYQTVATSLTYYKKKGLVQHHDHGWRKHRDVDRLSVQ